MLELMSTSVLRSIAKELQSADMFAIMADECVDISNREQLSICFRWVDSDLEVHEEFVGLYQIPDIAANTIVQALKDCLLRLNLQWNRCRGQCYDGASVMAGHKNGVATQILAVEPRALYTHCYGHSLNLAMCDAMKKCKVCRDALDVTHEICKLVKFSPKRNAIFDKLKEELSPETPGLRVLCPTRWTVRAKSLGSVLTNYSVLQQLWDSVLEGTLDPDTRAQVIIGVRAQMESFEYFFGVSAGELVLNHGDNLSATLQSSTISAAEGQRVASLTVTTLAKMRTDDAFTMFWALVQKKAAAVNVSEPSLPRRRKMPARFETGNAPAHFSATVESHYRQIYYEILDYATSAIKARFDQASYRIYQQAEDLLIKTVNKEDAISQLTCMTDFYGDDFDRARLYTQLTSLQAQFEIEHQKKQNFGDIVAHLKAFSPAERVFFLKY